MRDSAALLRTVEAFARLSGRPLRPYQSACAEAIARSAIRGEGKTFTVMFARQMGKNETSAQLEAYLMTLYAGRGGSIVKAAPSFKPQIVTSMLRLRDTLGTNPLTANRWRPGFGYIYAVGRATTTFLSADPQANVVGATASLLLEVDEAQDVDPDKYARDFRPMASSTNATTVMYGTAWARDSLLETQRRLNLEREAHTGERLHFEFDWRTLAKINPAYRTFVEAEMSRLGADHPTVRTQYLLETLGDAGRLFSEEQRLKLAGEHERCRSPQPNSSYIAGIDIAGADEEAEDAVARSLKPRKDSTVIIIAEMRRTDAGEPVAEVVETLWWTGRDHQRQLADILGLWDRWRFAHVAIDAGGIGYGIAQLLAQRQRDRLRPITFSRTRKSELGYALLAMINTSRFRLYRADSSPESNQLWWEIEHTRYHMHPQQVMSWSVPETQGHDDFVVALALAAEASAQSPAQSVTCFVPRHQLIPTIGGELRPLLAAMVGGGPATQQAVAVPRSVAPAPAPHTSP